MLHLQAYVRVKEKREKQKDNRQIKGFFIECYRKTSKY